MKILTGAVTNLAGGGALEYNLTGRCPFFKNSTSRSEKRIAFEYPVSELLDYKKIPQTIGKTVVYCSSKQWPIVLEQIIINFFGVSDQFSYPVQEFMLKNDTLENGTSRTSLYGSAPRAVLRFPPKK